MRFQILKKCKNNKARAGMITTAHGTIRTPAFTPVATKATVKSLDNKDLENLGTDILMCNTYHLMLKPGAERIEALGGLHKFMNWNKPIMTDSGGFQAFSLGYGITHNIGKIAIFPDEMTMSKQFNDIHDDSYPDDSYPDIRTKLKDKKIREKEYINISNEEGNRTKHERNNKEEDKKDIEEDKKREKERFAKITDTGITFRSIYDASLHRLTPEESIRIQEKLGSDIMFVLDECTSPLATYEYTKNSLQRTHRWAKKCLQSKKTRQALFGIIQGGAYKDLRIESAKKLSEMGFDGYGIGGSLGKSKKDMHDILDWVMPELPEDKPRHLLGIGTVEDIFESVERGIDLFDCVGPTRIARVGFIYINPKSGGNKKNKFRIKITKGTFKEDKSPPDPNCSCIVCKTYSRAYINHLFKSKELLAYRLCTIHNIHFFLSLMDEIRESIIKDNFSELKNKWLS